jgi:hypothetical protein
MLYVISILYFFSIFDVLVTCAIYFLVLLTIPGISQVLFEHFPGKEMWVKFFSRVAMCFGVNKP